MAFRAFETLTILALLLLAAVGLAACGGSGAQQSERVVESPGPVRDDNDARLASDGENLWFARTSEVHKRMITSVYEYRDLSWKSLPAAGQSTSSSPLLLIPLTMSKESEPTPCVGDTAVDGNARVRCLRSEKWMPLPITGSLAGMSLVDLKSTGSDGLALFYQVGINASMFRLARVSDKRITPLGAPVKLRGQVLGSIGETTSDAKGRDLIDIGFMGQMSDKRWIATLHPGGGWSHTPILAAKSGSQLSGPVRTADSLNVAVAEIRPGKSWPFSVRRYQQEKGWSMVGDEPLANKGQSQGGTYAVGNDTWVIWNQMEFQEVNSAGLAPTKIMAARIGKEGQTNAIQTLWDGRSLVPTNTQVVEYRDNPVFLYFRQFDAEDGMQATVNLLGP